MIRTQRYGSTIKLKVSRGYDRVVGQLMRYLGWIQMTLISQMPEHGVIFSDGMETDFLKFNAGNRAIITVAERKGQIVI